MPTGYTAKLYEGEQDFTDFVLRCSRGMGAAIMQRDSSLDVRIKLRKPSDYHVKALKRAEKRLDKYNSMSLEEAEQGADQEFQTRHEEWVESVEKKVRMRSRYQKMLSKVHQWTPPTSDHQGLKDFMIGQLKESIKFDTDAPGDGRWEPQPRDAETWLKDKTEQAERDIEYHTKEHEKELERCRKQNEWVRALADSLGVEVE